MHILPAEKSPLQNLLNAINNWDKSERFIVKHISTRVASAVALPFAALATLTYNMLAEFKWGVYLIGQFSRNGKKIAESLPKGFDKRSLVSHNFHIIRAVVAIFSFPIAVLVPKTYLNYQNILTSMLISKLPKKTSNQSSTSGGPEFIIDKDIKNEERRQKRLSQKQSGADVPPAPALPASKIEAVKDKRRSQRLSRIVDLAGQQENAAVEPGVKTPLPPPPPSSRGQKSRQSVFGLFPGQTTDDNAHDKIKDIGKILNKAQELAPVKTEGDSKVPQIPLRRPPAAPGAKKNAIAPTARILPKPPAAAKKGAVNNPKRRSQTVEETYGDAVANALAKSELVNSLHKRRLAWGTVTPAALKAVASPVTNDEWSDDE